MRILNSVISYLCGLVAYSFFSSIYINIPEIGIPPNLCHILVAVWITASARLGIELAFREKIPEIKKQKKYTLIGSIMAICAGLRVIVAFQFIGEMPKKMENTTIPQLIKGLAVALPTFAVGFASLLTTWTEISYFIKK